MAKNDIHLNDIGTIFRLTITDCVADVDVAVDVSAQTSMTFRFQKPDETTFDKTPVFGGTGAQDGTDGVLDYAAISGDMDAIGDWKVQGIVTIPAGTFSSSILKFPVLANLALPT